MMSENHICAAAKAMAQTYTTASVPLYGKKLRLPDRQAVILLIKDIRRLIFPAYYGEAALMSLAPEDYAALLLERIEKQLFSQIALALPEEQELQAQELAAEMVTRLPKRCSWIWRLPLTGTRQRGPGRRYCSLIRGCLPSWYTGWPMSCIR